MAGLNLFANVGGMGGVTSTNAPSYGSVDSYASGVSATSAAFAGPATTPVNPGSALSPSTGLGMATWIGAGAIALLVFIRSTLPN